MSLSIVKDSIDLGIITKTADKMLAFYRDTLGLEVEGELPMPDGGVMHRLKCGGSVIKIVVNRLFLKKNRLHLANSPAFSFFIL